MQAWDDGAENIGLVSDRGAAEVGARREKNPRPGRSAKSARLCRAAEQREIGELRWQIHYLPAGDQDIRTQPKS